MNRPSLQQLIDRAKSSLVSRLGVDNPAIDALAAAIGGGTYGNYAYQDYLFKQMHPETANEDWLYLWAERFNTPRIAPVQAVGSVMFTVTGGAVSVPSGVVLQTSDGKSYTTTQLTSAGLPVPVQCNTPGVDGNQSAGIKLSMLSAVPGLTPTEIVVVNLTGGADVEDLEHWRSRIIAAFNDKYMVGKRSDYAAWALSAHPDVGFAYALDNTPTLGWVSVYVGKRDDAPLVDATTLEIVQIYLDSKRLAGCHVVAASPAIKEVDITLAGVSDFGTRSAIEDALNAMFISKLGSRDSITPSDIMLTVTSITSDFGLVSPTSAATSDANEVLMLGEVSWT
ncbi:MAG: baseplate J/gp47 family protein [Thiotrichales bacterium]|jgi:uncharacterized phage protein gp47/JayE|nr:baseplate J/gp47 family protein [Thiotrichales bacterium]